MSQLVHHLGKPFVSSVPLYFSSYSFLLWLSERSGLLKCQTVFVWYLVEKKHWAVLVHFKTTLSNFFSTSTYNNECFSTTILRCKESCVCVCVTHLSFIWDTGEWSRRNKHKWVSYWIWGTKYTHTELSCNCCERDFISHAFILVQCNFSMRLHWSVLCSV